MNKRKIQISLAAARVNSELTQDDVAKKLHISKATLVNWEKGKTSPDITQAKDLSKLYKLPLDFLNFSIKEAKEKHN